MKQLHFNRNQLLRAIYLACVSVALSFTSAQAQTVVPSSLLAPYSADPTSGGSFTTTGSNYLKPGDSATWTPSAGGFQQRVVSNGFYSTANGAVTTVSNLGGASPSNFIETADMSAGSFSGYGFGSMGLIALGNGTTVSAYNSTGLGYSAGMNSSSSNYTARGQIGISAEGSSFTGVTGPSLTFNVGDTYHFELLGTYGAGNDLTLTLTVTDLNDPLNTGTVSADVGVALTGQNFGTQVGAVASGVTGTVSNFSVAVVPEPTDWALMLLGGAALLGIARHRKNATS